MDRLPQELIQRVVDIRARDNRESGREEPVDRQMLTLANVSRKFRAATYQVLSKSFSLVNFHTPSHRDEDIVPWLPRILPAAMYDHLHTSYWAYHLGPGWDCVSHLHQQSDWLLEANFSVMKSLELDLRIHGCDAELETWTVIRAPHWVATTAALTHVRANAVGLESMHIRMTPNAEQFKLVQDIIARNPLLRDITIEVDTALDANPVPRPRLSLSACTKQGRIADYAPLNRLVIRAPSCELYLPRMDDLFPRLKASTELRLICFRLEVPCEPWRFCAELIGAIPLAEEVELAAVCGPTSRDLPPMNEARRSTLPNLVKLHLDLPQVDSRLIKTINAVNLRELRIRTQEPLDRGNWMRETLFPGLTFIQIGCSCSFFARLSALGIAFETADFARHDGWETDDEYYDYDGDLVARIRPRLTSIEDPSRSLWLHSPNSPIGLIITPPSAQNSQAHQVSTSDQDVQAVRASTSVQDNQPHRASPPQQGGSTGSGGAGPSSIALDSYAPESPLSRFSRNSAPLPALSETQAAKRRRIDDQ